MLNNIAIVGMAYRLPVTENSNFYSDLLLNKSAITSVPASRWSQDTFSNLIKNHPGTSYTFKAGTIGDISTFDAEFFGISPRESIQMDPQQRLLLELSWECFENAGVRPSSVAGSQSGVYIGISSNDYAFRLSEDLSSIDSSSALGNTSSIAANRLSYFYDLHGPSMAIDTACSSALVAFHQACQAIRSGEITQALTGGVSLHLHPFGFIAFSKASMLSSKGQCSVYDDAADGYVRSEGAGLFLLKNYEKARADGDRIIAVIKNTAVNTDGKKTGMTVPSSYAQAELLRTAYKQAGIHPDSIDYIEAHGTGTPAGDPIEAHALGNAIGRSRRKDNPLPIGSIKSNIGHLEAASGVAGLVKSILAIQNRIIPATIGITKLNQNIDFNLLNLEVVTQNRQLPKTKPLTIGVNSFGFGGANAHIILGSPPQNEKSDAKITLTNPIPIVVTAASKQALRANAQKVSEILLKPDADLYGIAYELAFRRERLRHRAIIFADTAVYASSQLKGFSSDSENCSVTEDVSLNQTGGVAFVYSGNGCQWHGMGVKLLESRVFLNSIQQVDRYFKKLAGYSLEQELRGLWSEKNYEHTDIAQPALFAIQVGITSMLRAQGIHPTAITGHSVGEVAAAWAAGILDLGAAVSVIYHRSRLQECTKGLGNMTAVRMDVGNAEALISQSNLINEITIAAVNSTNGITIAGKKDNLDNFEEILKDKEFYFKRLDLDYSFHSSSMDVIQNEVLTSLDHLEPKDGSIAFYSTVTGHKVKGNALSANYWWDNIRKTVLFKSAVNDIIKQGINCLVEIGPQPILKSYLKSALDEAEVTGKTFHVCTKTDNTGNSVLRACAEIMIAGAKIDWDVYFPHQAQHITLSNYSWQKERHWHEYSSESTQSLERYPEHPLLGYRLIQQQWTWEQDLSTTKLAFLKDHVIGNSVVFPGSGYIELALAAASIWNSENTFQIENLNILIPITQFGYQGRLIRTQIDPSDGRVSIWSRERLSEEAWTLNANCRILKETKFPQLEKISIPLEKIDFDSELHRNLTQKVGLQYGPSFQGVQRGWKIDKDLIAEFNTPIEIQKEVEEYFVHPALLDCAFQLIVQYLQNQIGGFNGIALVPTQFEKIICKANTKPIHYVKLNWKRHLPHSLVVNFVLYDEECEVIAFIEHARFRSVRLIGDSKSSLKKLAIKYIPCPHYISLLTSNLSYDYVVRTFNENAQHSQTEKGYETYVKEVDPLLDALCEKYAHEALIKLDLITEKNEDTQLIRDEILLKDPQLAEYLNFIQWISRHDRDIPSINKNVIGETFDFDFNNVTSSDILSILLSDYPDFFHIIWAVAQIGQKLPDILSSSTQNNKTLPSSTSLASLNTVAFGNKVSAKVLDTILHNVNLLIDSQKPEDRIGILEISADKPQYLIDIEEHVELDQTNLVFTTDNHSFQNDISEELKKSNRIAVRNFENSLTSHSDPDVAPLIDLAIISLNFNSQDKNLRAIEYAVSCLKPEGVIAVIGQHPSLWVDFIFGINSLNWTRQLHTTQLNRNYWKSQLEAIGLQRVDIIDINRNLDITSGPYLILGKKPPQNQKEFISEKQSPRTWLILTDEIYYEDSLIAHIASEFQRADDIAIISDVYNYQDLTNLIVETKNKYGSINGIIHMHSLGQNPTLRCELASNILKACEYTQTESCITLITRAAMPPNIQSEKSNGLSDDAALLGFARTMLNEALSNSVRIIDISSNQICSKTIRLLIQEITYPDGETEVSLGQSADRFVPRITPISNKAIDALSPINDNALKFIARRLEFSHAGQLRNLKWNTYELGYLADDEVCIEVIATGLNFRDIMYTLGLLSDEAIETGFAGPSLGLEYSGKVIKVGKSVTHFSIGDLVVGFGSHGFSNYATTKSNALCHIPSNLSAEAAATIPSTFFTAYYSLHYLARLREGERVLIHGAAGGVGLAAIQIAKWCNAEIFATAGTDEKREFLKTIGVDNILDSRSLSFADDIMSLTNGEGVDIILNSLSGEAINRNFSILKPFGRFLELGKRDFYENTRIGLRPFRNNITYHGIDADQLMSERPELSASLFKEVINLFNQRILYPLPYTSFEARDVITAFRYMQQSQQIGKIIVTYHRGIPEIENNISSYSSTLTSSTRTEALPLIDSATYLVTGGTDGFGLRTAQWLVENGAKHLVLISRSGPKSIESQKVIESFNDNGVSVLTLSCDITDYDSLKEVFEKIEAELPPLKGIIHAAAVIEDSLIRNLSAENINRVFAPKILGAKNLDLITRNLNLDFFVLYSSATTLFGNAGQAAYVAANAWMEALATYRRNIGLPATCMLWGAIDDVGFLARNTKTKAQLQQRMGGQPLTSKQALIELSHAITTKENNIAILDFDWHKLGKLLPNSKSPKYDELNHLYSDQLAINDDLLDISSMLAIHDDSELSSIFSDLIKIKVGEILRIHPDRIDSSKSIYDMGLDSLMGVELVIALESRFGIRLPVMSISESQTIEKITQQLIIHLRHRENSSTVQDNSTIQINEIISQHAVTIPQKKIDQFIEQMSEMSIDSNKRVIQ